MHLISGTTPPTQLPWLLVYNHYLSTSPAVQGWKWCCIGKIAPYDAEWPVDSLQPCFFTSPVPWTDVVRRDIIVMNKWSNDGQSASVVNQTIMWNCCLYPLWCGPYQTSCGQRKVRVLPDCTNCKLFCQTRANVHGCGQPQIVIIRIITFV